SRAPTHLATLVCGVRVRRVRYGRGLVRTSEGIPKYASARSIARESHCIPHLVPIERTYGFAKAPLRADPWGGL
ncbi:MAG TPA: hypothetical protein VER03_21845, partial [Bryobacteraceae bacterium]|nr:hypothetical protein [Bryobacteraceae bacterium]